MKRKKNITYMQEVRRGWTVIGGVFMIGVIACYWRDLIVPVGLCAGGCVVGALVAWALTPWYEERMRNK